MGRGSVILVLCLLLFSFSLPSAANSFVNLQEGHWVYDDVAILSAGFPTVLGEAQGKQGAMNRYDVAVMVAKVIQHLDQRESPSIHRFGVSKDVYVVDLIQGYHSSHVDGGHLGDRIVSSLLRLTGEFRGELEVLGYAVKDEHMLALPDTPVSQRAEGVFLVEQKLLVPSQPINSPDAEGDAEEQDVSKRFWVSDNSVESRPQLDTEYRLVDSAPRPVDPKERGLFSSRFSSEREPVFWPLLDGRLPIGDDLVFEASYIALDEEPLEASAERNSLTASHSEFVDHLGLELAQNQHTSSPGVMQVGATMRLGDLQLGGSVRSALQGSTAESTAGYELTFRVGDLAVSTGKEELRTEDSARFTATSIDLSYGLPNDVLLSAGFRQVDPSLKTLAELGSPATTSLGLEVPIPRGRLLLGVASESNPSTITRYLDADVAQAAADHGAKSEAVTKTATVGLSYLLGAETSVQLNYKLIDFSGMEDGSSEQKANVASAEFSIRF